MICPHRNRREIADPQVDVERGRVLVKRIWFCYECGHKWWTKRKTVGAVTTISIGDDQ